MLKQSAGVEGARTTTGASPFLPNIACSKSDCSVFVGSPVLGPPLCTSIITNGSSVITAKPIDSVFNATPGPLVVVIAKAPENEAPITAVIAEISSSA